MTAHRQAVRLLAPEVTAGDSLLDVGCGSGYLFHALTDEELPVEYHGIDSAPSLLDIGRTWLPGYGLPPDRLIDMRIEDLSAEVDHVVCVNVLSNVDNFHRPLERMLLAARKTVILRESMADFGQYSYVEDRFLDAEAPMKVYVNTYRMDEIGAFMESYGFDTQFEQDDYTKGEPQLVIGHPHHWAFAKATRRGKRG